VLLLGKVLTEPVFYAAFVEKLQMKTVRNNGQKTRNTQRSSNSE